MKNIGPRGKLSFDMLCLSFSLTFLKSENDGGQSFPHASTSLSSFLCSGQALVFIKFPNALGALFAYSTLVDFDNHFHVFSLDGYFVDKSFG